MASYLITGVAGFIGNHLARALLARGHRVTGLDDFSSGRPENLADLPNLCLVRGSVTAPTSLATAMRDVDFVLHHAAIASVPQCLAQPQRSLEVNAIGTLRVLEAARAAKVSRVVLASSSAIYGNAHAPPLREDCEPDPLSPYATHKLESERCCEAFERGGLACVRLRYFNVYGPRQNVGTGYAAVIPKFIARLLRGEAPVIYGDGRQSRDFTYVGDVVRANLLACEAPAAAGQAINVACGAAISLRRLVRELQAITGQRLAPRFEPALPGEVRHSCADVARAQALLHFTPGTALREGLRQTVRWYGDALAATAAGRGSEHLEAGGRSG